VTAFSAPCAGEMGSLSLWGKFASFHDSREINQPCRHDNDPHDNVHCGQPIRVCVRRARDLPPTDTWPKNTLPDSYVLLTLVGGRGGRQECRSPAEPNTANPVYDLCCDMESPEAGLLRIQIFDYDEFSHHKEIGACKLRPIPTPLHWCELRREADHQVELGADIEVMVALRPSDSARSGGLPPAMPPHPHLPPLSPDGYTDVNADVIFPLIVFLFIFVAVAYGTARSVIPSVLPGNGMVELQEEGELGGGPMEPAAEISSKDLDDLKAQRAAAPSPHRSQQRGRLALEM